MNNSYTTKHNDVLDAICAKIYLNTPGATEIVLEANPNLADYGMMLPAGITITLPAISTTENKQSITLW
jgi:phage tail protein X